MKVGGGGCGLGQVEACRMLGPAAAAPGRQARQAAAQGRARAALVGMRGGALVRACRRRRQAAPALVSSHSRCRAAEWRSGGRRLRAGWARALAAARPAHSTPRAKSSWNPLASTAPGSFPTQAAPHLLRAAAVAGQMRQRLRGSNSHHGHQWANASEALVERGARSCREPLAQRGCGARQRLLLLLLLLLLA